MNINVLMGVMNIFIFKPAEAETSCVRYMASGAWYKEARRGWGIMKVQFVLQNT